MAIKTTPFDPLKYLRVRDIPMLLLAGVIELFSGHAGYALNTMRLSARILFRAAKRGGAA